MDNYWPPAACNAWMSFVPISLSYEGENCRREEMDNGQGTWRTGIGNSVPLHGKTDPTLSPPPPHLSPQQITCTVLPPYKLAVFRIQIIHWFWIRFFKSLLNPDPYGNQIKVFYVFYEKNFEKLKVDKEFKKWQIFYLGLHKQDVQVSRETFSHPSALQIWILNFSFFFGGGGWTSAPTWIRIHDLTEYGSNPDLDPTQCLLILANPLAATQRNERLRERFSARKPLRL